GRLAQHEHAHGLRRYTYDKSGNLTRRLDTRQGQHDYHYDPLDRLTRADHSQAPTERFAHDPAGNLLMQDRPGPGIVVGNRLLLQGDRHYDYDAFGNLIRERRGRAQQWVTEYRYDCQHRLTGVTQPDGSQASYRYDPFGRRISKTVAGKTTEFFWQGDKIIAEHTAGQHRSYLYEPDSFRPLALLEGFGPANTKAFHYQLDHLGTPQELTNAQGKIVWSAHYLAYGQIARLDVGIVDNPLRFQGQYFDRESGLHYNRHRYYNPDNGRYLTPDPVKLAGGLNGYLYVPNPTGWVDPLGLNSCPGKEKCEPVTEGQNPSTNTETNEGAPSAPTPATKKQYLYRGDSRHPNEIFKHGFKSRGKSTDLLLHSRDNTNPPSNFVPTSTSRDVGMTFATSFGLEDGFLYTLKKIPGRDVNKELGILSDYKIEKEIAIPDRIDRKDILGATPVNEDGTSANYSLINPYRK
ncbi:RHS repeat-associated core domain-containing protein, partial [Pseudomonas gessardii]